MKQITKKRIISLITLSVVLASSINLISKAEVSNTYIKNSVFETQNPLGITYSENKIKGASKLTAQNKFVEAKKILLPLTKWLEDSTEFHAGIYQTFRNIDDAKNQADIEKDLALKTAVLRDKALFQLGNLYLQENNKRLAVECYVKVVKSQPQSELGFKAYEQLQKIGFTYKATVEEKQTPITQTRE